MKVLGVYNWPAFITLLGLVSGLLACTLSVSGHLEFAVVALIWAGVFDLFDGLVARRLSLSHDERRFGIEIDSITDVVSFGVAPVVVTSAWCDNFVGVIVAGAIYLCAAAQRLAFFNITQATTEGSVTYYLGLPVTFAALIFGVLLSLQLLLPPVLFQYFCTLLLLVIALAFVVPMRIPKPNKWIYIIMPLLALIFTVGWLKLGIKGVVI